jgi:hypothetical protein
MIDLKTISDAYAEMKSHYDGTSVPCPWPGGSEMADVCGYQINCYMCALTWYVNDILADDEEIEGEKNVD